MIQPGGDGEEGRRNVVNPEEFFRSGRNIYCSAVCFYLDKVSLAALPGCESDPDAWYRIKLARLLPGTHSLLFFPVEGSVGQYREVGWGSEGG